LFTAASSDALEGGCELSHKGDQIACVHLPSGYHTGSGMMPNIPGSVILLTLDGKLRRIGGEWQAIFSLVCAPDDSELWIAASREGGDRKILALRLDGSVREVLSAPGDLYIADLASD
jgi:hypothetical protein